MHPLPLRLLSQGSLYAFAIAAIVAVAGVVWFITTPGFEHFIAALTGIASASTMFFTGVLSPRTVEMYVGNILAKLNCASRAEATHRAHELRLLPSG
jgi:hypothetical protein